MAKNNWNYCAPALTGPGAAGAAGAGPGGNFAAVKRCSLTGAEKSQRWWVWGEGLQDMERNVAFSHPLLSRPAPQGQCFRSRAGVKAGPDPRLASWRAAVAAVGSFQHSTECVCRRPPHTLRAGLLNASRMAGDQIWTPSAPLLPGCGTLSPDSLSENWVCLQN